MSKIPFDFSGIEKKIEDAEKYKEVHKEVEPTPQSRAGMRPLEFQHNAKFSSIKTRIIDEFNLQKKVQKDLYEFCTSRRGDGNYDAGMKEANGICNGLLRNIGFTDHTLLILLEFLGLDIQFIKVEDTFSKSEEVL